eukprot:TRINITY_DN50550_c0_g1_i1.p1 TRINITY_DN50550_c0_g1~~TRINITY_DN50550_c0_g1_i1.p1  ORF type:complete len:308 (+),score=110.19 TRINITY_DN50550_c0_g1_i1:76-924(+)
MRRGVQAVAAAARRRGFSALSTEHIKTDLCHDCVAVVRLARPPVNAFGLELFEQLTTVFSQAPKQPEVKAVVLTSAFPTVFCGGLDLTALRGPTEQQFKQFWGAFETAWQTLYTCSLPVVAAVNGPAPALGSVLALSCDYRILADGPKVRFGLNEAALGMMPPIWLQHLCARTVGERRAETLMQQGPLLNAQDSLRVGYVDELRPAEEVIPAAEAEALRLSKLPATARALTKGHQRRAVAAMAGPESVDMMWGICSAPDFQNYVGGFLDAQAKRAAGKGSKL